MQRNILTVFIASPGDLNEERNIAREVCSRVNNVLGRTINWEVELLGWEDTIPGANRPQSIINEDIKECDLFLGLLWKRWGMSTGEFDSGFMEEYTLAKQLRDEKNNPEMWLFLKEISASEISDPGPQLSKVLEFKRMIENDKQIMYKSFIDKNDFNTKFYDYLLRYILQLSEKRSLIETNESEKSNIVLQNKRIENDHVYSTDIARILEYNEEEDKLLLGLNLNRINLFTSLLITRLYGPLAIDNHMINRVYANRDQFELSNAESNGLIPILLNDNKYHPGWFWLRKYSSRKIYSIIRDLILSDQKKLRIIGYKSIIKYNISINLKNKLERIIEDDAILEILPLVRKTEFIDDIITRFKETKNNSLKKEIQKIEFEKLVKTNYSESIDFFISNISFNYDLLEQIPYNFLNGVEDNIIKNIYKEISNDKKLLLLKLAFISNKFEENDFNHIFDIGNLGCQESILREALKRDYKKFLSDKLEKILKDDLYNIDLVIKVHKKLKVNYSIIPEKPDILLEYRKYEIQNIINIKKDNDSVRKSLDDGFHSFFLLAEDKYRKTYGIDSEDFLEDELIQFLIARYIKSALKVILQDLKKEDVLYARKYYSNTLYNVADNVCLEIFKEIGKKEDLEILKSVIIKNNDDKQNKICMDAIIRINPSIENIMFLIEIGKKTIITEVQPFLNSYPEKISIDLIVSKLASDNSYIRNAYMNYIISNDYDLSDILGRYFEETYYYNVVVILDSILYAPKKIKDSIIADIKKGKSV